MITRRIIACACALALAVPAVASARPGFEAPVPDTSHVVYGDTKYDLQNTQDLAPKGVTGDTKGDVKPAYVDRVGSLTAAQLAAATGWVVGQDYSSSNTFTWFPPPGENAMQVWVRAAGSTATYQDWLSTGVFSIGATMAQ